MDTRTVVWVSTPEKFSKIVLGKTRNFSQKFRGVSAPALVKNPAATKWCDNPHLALSFTQAHLCGTPFAMHRAMNCAMPHKTWETGNHKRPGSRGFKKLSEFGNSSLPGYESSQNTCFTAFQCNQGRMIRDRSLLSS